MIAVEVAKNPGHFDCETCDHRNCNQDNPAPFDRWVIPGLISSSTCLKPMITARSSRLIQLYGHYKNQILAFSGGILEQPAVYMQAMQLIDNLANEKRNNADTKSTNKHHGKR